MKPDEGLCVYGADVIDPYLDDLLEEVEGVRQAADIEYIHRMRVASRRLRAALPLFEVCFPKRKFGDWAEQIKKITHALGMARDLDVQLERVRAFESEHDSERYRPGLRRLELRLSQKRSKIQRKVNLALDTLMENDVSGQIQKKLKPYLALREQVYLYTPALYQLGYHSIQEHLIDLLDYEEFVHQPEKITELHAMRIAAKRLRYTLEIFAPLYPGELKDPIQAARKAQDLLGEVHDADVWVAFLPQFIEDERARTLAYFGHLHSFHRLVPGLTCFLEDRQAQREKKYQEFVVFWDRHKAAGTDGEQKPSGDGQEPEGKPRNGDEKKPKATWQTLLQTIQIPYYQGEQPSSPEEDAAKTNQEVAG